MAIEKLKCQIKNIPGFQRSPVATDDKLKLVGHQTEISSLCLTLASNLSARGTETSQKHLLLKAGTCVCVCPYCGGVVSPP